MNIPVDGVIIRSSGVLSNESALTGESYDLKKDTFEGCLKRQRELESENDKLSITTRSQHSLPSPILLSGTQIVTGEGWFICIVLGKNSSVGKIIGKLE